MIRKMIKGRVEGTVESVNALLQKRERKGGDNVDSSERHMIEKRKKLIGKYKYGPGAISRMQTKKLSTIKDH